jgi:bifunctional non-homologous end joining protein LigD
VAKGASSGGLDRYRAQRDFQRTPEPAGQAPARRGGANRFVVQRHRARRLHYDLRLEIDGVLVSWAVPKGPTLDPTARNLAVHVEDHPVEYLDFEGTIPRGEYGGGDVIVWDRGSWSLDKGTDPAQALADGELHFDVHGEKLRGRFVLVRRDRGGDHDNWLLLHKRDEHAVPGWNPEDHPRSVKTGRTNDEVAAAPMARWHGDRPAAEAEELLEWSAPTAAEVARLDALGDKGRWHFDGRDLALTNLDKTLFPASSSAPALGKRDLIRYYACVAPTILPFLADRPLNLNRFPNGIDKPGFWHKEVPGHAPEWITRWRNPGADPGETTWYFVADRPATLAWLANYGAVELHAWTSRRDRPDEPTWAMIDIDPGPETSWDETLVLARLYRTALDHLDVLGAPKVTGQRGIQVWVPVGPGYTFDDTRRWVEQLSRAVGATVPDLVSWRWQKRQREGRARLDYTQNARNKTLVAPYSVRAAPGAPVSMPIRWEELDDSTLAPDRWTIADALDRISEHGDPFRRVLGVDQRLPALS